jgi:hypothetical protein
MAAAAVVEEEEDGEGSSQVGHGPSVISSAIKPEESPSRRVDIVMHR